jgi:hypothetical protein
MSNADDDGLTLLTVANKVQQIADKEYNGNIFDNVLTIFRRLSVSERRVMLIGIMGIYLCSSNTKRAPTTPVIYEKPTVEVEIGHIETYNHQELMKLKSWLVKTITLTILASLGLIFLIGATIEKSEHNLIAALVDFFAVLKVMFF